MRGNTISLVFFQKSVQILHPGSKGIREKDGQKKKKVKQSLKKNGQRKRDRQPKQKDRQKVAVERARQPE